MESIFAGEQWWCPICGGADDMGNCGCDYFRHLATEMEGKAWMDAGVTLSDMTAAVKTLYEWNAGLAAEDALVIALSIESIESIEK